MSRKRRRREVSTPISSLTLSLPSAARSSRSTLTLSPSRSILQQIEDRRDYHPLNDARPARFMTGGSSHLTVKDRSYGRQVYRDPFSGRSGTKAVVAFRSPDATVLCVRRKVRKEVLHAKRKAGRGGPQRRHRRNWFSKVSCR